MASRDLSSNSNPNQKGVELTAPTIPGFSEGGGGGGGSSSQSSFAGIDNPEALGILMDFIRQTAGGGTEEQRRQRAERNTQIASTRGTLGDYTKEKAFTDAVDLMAQNLRKSLEANMPAISRSIQGAGTSASSMQGLLSQKLATESAQAAGALGAEQAKSYGNISAGLQGVLEMLTRIDPSIEANLLKALELTKVSSSYGSSVTNPTNPTKQVGQSGGGTYWQPLGADGSASNGDYQGAIQSAVQAPSYGPGEGYVINNNSGEGTLWNQGQETQFEAPQQYFNYSAAEEEPTWGYGD